MGVTYPVYTIAWDGSKFVAGGAGGRIATSPDGITWTYQSGLYKSTWGTSASVFSIIWANNKFIAVGSIGKCATSPDGITWTYQPGLNAVVGSTFMRSIVWNGSKFIAAGDKMASSPDGITWTLITTTIGSIMHIEWDGAKFITGGSDKKTATSPDGITWTVVVLPIGVTTTYVYSIGYGKLLAITENGIGYTSFNDGATWVQSPLFDTAPRNIIDNVINCAEVVNDSKIVIGGANSTIRIAQL